MMYRMCAKDYKVYSFSRKNEMEEGYTTREMAKDLKIAMIEKAHLLGISQGGMISQYLAIDYPEVVYKLVIALSASRRK